MQNWLALILNGEFCIKTLYVWLHIACNYLTSKFLFYVWDNSCKIKYIESIIHNPFDLYVLTMKGAILPFLYLHVCTVCVCVCVYQSSPSLLSDTNIILLTGQEILSYSWGGVWTRSGGTCIHKWFHIFECVQLLDYCTLNLWLVWHGVDWRKLISSTIYTYNTDKRYRNLK